MENDTKKTDIFEFSSKHDWAHKLVQKCKKAFEKEETRKMIEVFIVDPIIEYTIKKIIPYILIISVLFIILTILISLILVFIFTKMPRIINSSPEFVM